MTKEIELAVPDPRTVDPDVGRDLAQQTFVAMANAWVWMAAWFRRVQEEEYWDRWGFESWTEYLRSDMSGMSKQNALKMTQALDYVEEREPKLAKALLNGTGGAGDTPLLDYEAVSRLDSLAYKAENGAVDQEDYEELHRQAFEGELSGQEVRRKVSELSKGITHRRDVKDDPEAAKAEQTRNKIIYAAEALKGLRKMAADEAIPPLEGRSIVRSLVRFEKAIIHTFGEKQLDAVVREAKHQEDEKGKRLGA